MSGKHSIELAKEFPNTRTRKRFLSQILPLQKLLRMYGLNAQIVNRTWFYIKKQELNVVVGLKMGDCRFQNDDDIFCICLLERNVDYHVNANQLKGVIRTLVRWGLLRMNEIPEEMIEQTVEEGFIRCDSCDRAQLCRFSHRFKQCKLCNDRERVEDEPGFNGFYCCKECQVANWSEHKRLFH